MNDANNTSFDWRQFKILLRVYFTLNSRGHLVQPYQRQGKSMHLSGIILMYALFGLPMGIFLQVSKDPAPFLVMMQAMTMMMVLMIAIMESNQVLFNPLEEDVLGHRPIGARTLLAAKVANMIGITLLVAGALNLAPAFFLLGAKGALPWIWLVHLAIQPLACAFCCAAVVFIFGLISRTVGRERFQMLVTWSQIVMIVTASIGYQILAQVMGDIKLETIEPWLPWLAPLPPVWFMGLELSLATRQASLMTAGLGLLALAATAALGWAAIERLSGLQGKISESLGERQPAKARPRAAKPAAARRLSPLLRAWLRDPVERAAFTLATSALRRDRFIMQQIYPQLAFVVAYPALMIFTTGRHQHGPSPAGTGTGFFLMFGAWMLSTLPVMALEVFKTAEHPEASLIFGIAPLERPGRLFTGTRKAVLLWLVLPVVAVLGLIGVFWLHISRNEALVALPLLLTLPTISLLPALGERHYIPFSNIAQRGNKAERFGMMFVIMIGMLVLMGISYLAREFGFLHWLLLAEVLLLIWFHRNLLRHIGRRTPIRIDN